MIFNSQTKKFRINGYRIQSAGRNPGFSALENRLLQKLGETGGGAIQTYMFGLGWSSSTPDMNVRVQSSAPPDALSVHSTK